MAEPLREISYSAPKRFVYESSDFTPVEKSIASAFDDSLRDVQTPNLHAFRQDSARRFLSQQNQKTPQENSIPIGQLAVCAITLGLFCAVGCSPSFEDVGDPNKTSNGRENDNRVDGGFDNDGDESTTDSGANPDRTDAGRVGNEDAGTMQTDGGLMDGGSHPDTGGIEHIEKLDIPTPSRVFDLSLVWNGHEYAASWDTFHSDNTTSDLHLTQINVENNNVDTFALTDEIGVLTSSTVWSGNAYGVKWDIVNNNDRKINFVKVDRTGQKIGDIILISDCELGCGSSTFSSTFAWSGREFIFVWLENSGISFKAIDISENTTFNFGINTSVGVDVWSDLALAAGPDQYAITGMGYFTSGEGTRNIFFASAEQLPAFIRVTHYSDRWLHSSSMVWNGNGYALSWSHCQDSNNDNGITPTDNCEIYFKRLDPMGTNIGDDVQITNHTDQSVWPSLVWTGTEYGVSWMDWRNGSWEVYFSRIDEEGNKIEDDFQITNSPTSPGRFSLAWNDVDREYAVCWKEDDQNPDPKFHIARIIGNF